MKNFGNNAWLGIMNMIYSIHSKNDVKDMSKMILKQLQWLVPYDHAIFCLPNKQNKDKTCVIASANLSDKYVELYENNYKRYDHASGLKIGGNSIVYRESDIIEKKVFENSLFYQQFCEPNNIMYGIHLVLVYNEQYCGEMILFRDTNTINAAEFGENAEFILNLIKEHLSLAVHRMTEEKKTGLVKVDEKSDALNEKIIFEYGLTKREAEILRLLMKDSTTAEICDELIISTNTLKKHTMNIYKKLEVNSRIQLVQKMQMI